MINVTVKKKFLLITFVINCVEIYENSFKTSFPSSLQTVIRLPPFFIMLLQA